MLSAFSEFTSQPPGFGVEYHGATNQRRVDLDMDIRADLPRDLAEQFEAAARFADRAERVAPITIRFGCFEDRYGSFGEVLYLGE